MTATGRLQLQTETQPGKPRDPFLDQQMNKVQNAVNSANDLLAVVSGIWANISVTADYSASVNDTAIFVDSTAGVTTVILPSPAQGAPAGKVYAVKNWKGPNAVNVDGILPDMSNTQNVTTLAAGESVIICLSSDVQVWYQVVARG